MSNKIKDIRNVIAGLEKEGLEQRSIVSTLIHSTINRKLEMSEVEYIITYLNGLEIQPVQELRSCSPCPNINDLIYRLLELPSEQEIDDFIGAYLNEHQSHPADRKDNMKDLYYYIIGKLDKDEKDK